MDGHGGDEKSGVALTRSAPRFIDTPLLERVARELRDIERRNGIQRTLAIGELVLNEFFGGSIATWRDRRRNKNNSIRRLAERSDCPFCRSSLNEAVAVYVASLELPCVRTFGHVGASHVASVLTLSVTEQAAMLESAERDGLSVRALRERVVRMRRDSGERRGRPSLAASARVLSAIESDVRRVTLAMRRLGGFEPDAAARERLLSVAGELAELSARVEALAAGPGELRRTSELRLRERSA